MKIEKPKISINNIKQDFSTKESCFKYIFERKIIEYNNSCPKCGKNMNNFYFLENRNLFACSCGFQIYPAVNTIFENSKTSIELWFYVIYLFSIYGEKLTAKDIQREIQVTYKTAWKMATRIKEYI